MAAAPSPVAPGDIVAGKYRVERVIGAGGMGVIVLAFHTELHAQVALKFMTHKAAHDEAAVERFSREARAAFRLKSEHTGRVLDSGRLPDGGPPFIVMEYLDGEDLGHLVQREGPLPVGVAVRYVLQACEAVAEAHSVGIVHRDLKPSNLFLTTSVNGEPLIKVLDFGLAKADNAIAGTGGLTQTTDIMGSPNYMSPEQMRSTRDVDLRTDIWSLGACLYELLTGTVPFPAESVPELIIKVATEAPTPLDTHRPDLPPEVEKVILRCLEKKREDRFQAIGEMVRALGNLPELDTTEIRHEAKRATGVAEHAERRAASLMPVVPVDPNSETLAANALVDTNRPSTLDSTERVPRRSRSVILVGAGVAVAVAVAVGIGLFSSSKGAPAPLIASPAAIASAVPPKVAAPVVASAIALPQPSSPAEPRAAASAPPDVLSPPIPVPLSPKRPAQAAPQPKPRRPANPDDSDLTQP